MNGAYISNTGSPGDLVVLGMGDNQVVLNGAGEVRGAFYVPGGRVTLNGADVRGAVVADRLIAERSSIVHDPSLRALTLDGIGGASVVSFEIVR